MADEFDPFAGDTGLVDDFDGVIVDAFFGTDPQYNNGQTWMLFLKLQTDNPDNKYVTNRYTLGGDWASYDGGVTVEHPKGPRKLFQNQTQIFQWLSSALQSGDAAAAVIRKRGMETTDDNGNPLGPKDARIWIGLGFHVNIKTEEVKFKNKEGEMVERTTNRPLATRWLGEFEVASGGDVGENYVKAGFPIQGGTQGGTETSGTQAPGSASGSASTGESSGASAGSNQAESSSAPTSDKQPENPGNGSDDLSAEDRAKMKVLASQHDTYESFVDAALPSAMGNATLVEKLSSPAFYTELRA